MNDKANRYNPVTGAVSWIWQFYRDGFMSMTVGRQLWGLIIFKILVLLLVFRIFFFPDILQRDYDTDDERAGAVRSSLLDGRRH